MTPTMTLIPTPTLPSDSPSEPASSSTRMSSEAVIEIDCAGDGGALWFTDALFAMKACVVRLKTSTMNEPPTATPLVPAPPATATEVTSGTFTLGMMLMPSGTRDADALSEIAPPAFTMVGCWMFESM